MDSRPLAEKLVRQGAPFEWVPKQAAPSAIHDLRGAVLGPKGYKERQKRKLDEMEALHQEDLEQQAAMEGVEEQPPQQAEQQSGSKRRKAEGVKYIPVSGRVWKAPAQRSNEVMKPKINNRIEWEKKQAAKASRALFLEQKRAAIAENKANRKAKALQKKQALELKKSNRGKSEVVQKITNNATLKKMMKNKKQKKTLRKADTN